MKFCSLVSRTQLIFFQIWNMASSWGITELCIHKNCDSALPVNILTLFACVIFIRPHNTLSCAAQHTTMCLDNTHLCWLSSNSCLMCTNSSEDWSNTVRSQRSDRYLLSMLLLVDQLVLSPTLTTSLTSYSKWGISWQTNEYTHTYNSLL